MTDAPDFDPTAQAQDVTPPNRGYDNKFEDRDAAPRETQVTLMRIDETIINYLVETIQPSVIDNDRQIPVPVIYASPERWKAIRRDGYLRDPKNDKAQTPLITIRRSKVSRNNMTNPSNKYLYMTHRSQWNRRNAYDRFAVQNNIRPSSEFINIIIPDYIDITYELILWTEYQEQMNMLVEQINVENEEWWGVRNQYKFRVRIDDYSNQSELPPERDRMVRTSFDMKVSAYLVPERMVKNFALASTHAKSFSQKKLITFVELDQTGTNTEIKEYYNRMKSVRPENR